MRVWQGEMELVISQGEAVVQLAGLGLILSKGLKKREVARKPKFGESQKKVESR